LNYPFFFSMVACSDKPSKEPGRDRPGKA